MQMIRVLLAADELELKTLLKQIEHFSRKTTLILNRAQCSIITIDRAGKLPETFVSIPNIEKRVSVTYLFEHRSQIKEVMKIQATEHRGRHNLLEIVDPAIAP